MEDDKDSQVLTAQPQEAATEVEVSDNPYSALTEEARDNLLRLMHNTDNEKLSKEISVEILDRAGERKADTSAAMLVNVNISDQDVSLMIATAREVRNG